ETRRPAGTDAPPYRYTAAMANEIELAWQRRWAERGTFHAVNPTGDFSDGEVPDETFYLMDMFPYPSGKGLHVGHPLGYIATRSEPRRPAGTDAPPYRYTAAMANEIELAWQRRWAERGTFHAVNPTGDFSDGEVPDETFYLMDMFPYPSGKGLHVGHPLGYIAT